MFNRDGRIPFALSLSKCKRRRLRPFDEAQDRLRQAQPERIFIPDLTETHFSNARKD